MDKYFKASEIVLLCLLVIMCAYTDVMKRKIYDVVTLPAIFLGFAVNYLAGGVSEAGTTMNLFNSLIGLIVGMGIFLLPHLLNWFAGGDVKLMAGVGALVGWPGILLTVTYIVLVGAAMAVVVSLWHGKLVQTIKLIPRTVVKLKSPQAEQPPEQQLTIPYGLAICLGTFWALLLTVIK